MKKRTRILIFIAVLGGASYGLYRYFYPQGIYCYYYPFGACHRCNTQLAMALLLYAEKHDGKFPAGQATPEASLCLIHELDGYQQCAYLLRRRDVPEEVEKGILDRGQLLGPDTCGWNYIEGLRRDSDPQLALFWDKEGLDEMGRRLSAGGHCVTFVDGHGEYVPASEWDAFLERQRQLREQEKAKKRADRHGR